MTLRAKRTDHVGVGLSECRAHTKSKLHLAALNKKRGNEATEQNDDDDNDAQFYPPGSALSIAGYPPLTMSTAELACSYAALILADDGVDVTVRSPAPTPPRRDKTTGDVCPSVLSGGRN